MAKELMDIEVFAISIRRSAEVLKPYGLDLIDFVTNGVKDNARILLSAFVSIAAVQIALVDILNVLEIQPDGMIGHSVGELGCAYADGGFTAEQMVLAAFWRGRAIEETTLEEGAMAAIGMTWSEAKTRCPKDIFPSCHNAEDSVTVSGPKDSLKVFVDALKYENVFVRAVDSCGYAFHSQYIYPTAEKLKIALEMVIPKPLPRTSRWVSSSYSEDQWGDPCTQLADASYFVHNLVSPVLFHEALHHVPKDAIVIEIAPHHLLQSILKRSIGPDAEYIGLMKKNVDNTVHLLCSIGRMYTSGLNPNIEKLYPQVHFPVPRTTPMIAPLIQWDHSGSWSVAKWDRSSNQYKMIVEVNAGSEGSLDRYILDHYIDGRCLYPAAGYLVIAWRAFAQLKGKEMTKLPVSFEEVKIIRATVLPKTEPIKFLILSNSGGEFEISEGGMIVCTGRIFSLEESDKLKKYVNPLIGGIKDLKLNANDFYKELRLRGYEYGSKFQGVLSSDFEGNQGLLKWTGNWVVFLDTMLQFTIMSSSKRDFYLISRIQSLKINPIFHKTVIECTSKDLQGIPITHEKNTGRCISGGVEFKNTKTSFAPRNQRKQLVSLEVYRFMPYHEPNILSKSDDKTLKGYVHVCSSLAKMIFELSVKNKDQISEFMNGFTKADDSLIKNYLNSSTGHYVLLKLLWDILNMTPNNDLKHCVKKHVNNYLSERENDILSKTLLQETPLRTVMDVILENISWRKLKIAEASDSSLLLSPQIDEFMQTIRKQNVRYLIAHSEPERLMNPPSQANFHVTLWDSNSFDFKDVDVFVMNLPSFDPKEYRRVIENATVTLKDNGFIIALQRTMLIPAEMFLSKAGGTMIPTHSETDLEQVFKELNLQIICKKSDSMASTLYLLRKVSAVTYEESMIKVLEDHYEKWVVQLKEKMAEAAQTSSIPKRIWLVSEGTNISGIIGLVNCLRMEPGGSSLRCIFTGKGKLPEFSFTNKFYQEVIEKNLTMNVFKGGSWGSYRHLKMPEAHETVETNQAYLNVMTRGDLSSLVWVDSPLEHFIRPTGSVLCQVYYAPLNFRDVMLASGNLAPDSILGNLASRDSLLGLEFSGRLSNGQRVMGAVPCKGMATTVVADPDFMWDVPEEWSLEGASTVPIAYSTAYYALIIRGNLKKGERILIHSGSGGVGQAAIAIALKLGCEVFTTVGMPEKREFLKKRFPGLQDKNICNSRDTLFEQYIRNATNGKGVDVILNSLANEKLKASVNCLALNGRFLEIGKYDMSNNNSLGMAIFLKNISFHGVLLDFLFENTTCSSRTKKEIVELVKEGITDGTVKPLNSILFNHDQAEEAFRYMASGRHTGKVVLKIKEEESQKKNPAVPVCFKAIPRTTCSPEKSYVIIGGLGGFGLELCQWLVERGARHIILTSRSGIRSGYQQLCLNRWTKESINVVVSKLDATKLEEAESLLKLASAHGPVGGIFNLPLVLRDAFMENQTVDNFVEVGKSKIMSTLNLDTLSRELCPELEWFVCFSSLSSGRGNVGQGNYGYANSAMERICEERSLEGLPGLAIQWGPVADVGVIHNTLGSDAVIAGTVPQRIQSCLSVLEKFLQQSHSVVSSLAPHQPSDMSAQKASKHHVMSTVAKIFGIKDASTLSANITLSELGMDSLIAVELKQFLERDFAFTLTIPELRHLKVKDLKNLECSKDEGKSSGKPSNKSVTETGAETKIEIIPSDFSKYSSKELVPDKALIHMNSANSGTPLIIVHPIEGIVSMLNTLARTLPFPVYGLQCTPEAPLESIEKLAAWYWQHLQSTKGSEAIYLAGYSFGATVAFEMCLQAERDPRTHPTVVSLILLDGAPSFCLAYRRIFECHDEDSKIEAEATTLCWFVLHFRDVDMIKFKSKLVSLPSFDARVKFAAEEIVQSRETLRMEDVATSADMYYKKFQIFMMYTPKYRLQKDLTLIKASDSVEITKTLSDVYDLDRVCVGKITTHTIHGTHRTFIRDKATIEVSNVLSGVFSY